MLNIIFTTPVVLLLFISPFLTPLRILQFLIVSVAIADPYIAAFVMIVVTPIIYYKIFFFNGIKLNVITNFFLIISLVWIIYAAFTLLWLVDLSRFITEYIQLLVILLLTIALISNVKSISEVKSTNFSLIFCGCLVSITNFISSFNSDYIQNNYFAFISLVTCIAIPICFINFKNRINIFLNILFIIIGFLGIISNGSRASTLLGILLIVIRFFFLLEIKKRLKLVTIFIVLFTTPFVLVWYYNMNDDNILKSVTDVDRNYSNLERLSLFNQSIDTYLSYPLGVGFGSTNSVFMSGNSYTVFNYPHPHNSIAHIAVEIGTVGIFIFIYLFYLSFKVSIKLKKYKKIITELNSLYNVSICIGLALFIFSFFDDIFFNGMFNFYCFIFLGYVFALYNCIPVLNNYEDVK